MNHWPHTPNSHFQFTGGGSKTQVSVTTCLIGGIEVFALNSLLCRHVLQQNFSCCRRQLLFCWAISRLMVPWGLQACDWHILSSQRWKNNQPTNQNQGMIVYVPLLPSESFSHPHPDGVTLLWRKDLSPSTEQWTIQGQLLMAWPQGITN